MATSLLFGGFVTTSGGLPSSAAIIGAGFEVNEADLAFILKQIQISENHVANTTTATGPCGALVGDGVNEIPEVRLPFGLRTVSGICNHLEPGTEEFGASDTIFPRMTTPVFQDADPIPPGFPGAGSPTTYNSQGASGNVFDADPRMISNLIVDQTPSNPAAVLASGGCLPGDMDGENCAIGNVAPDAGLSAPFNSMFTFFGQFFDHGLDLVNKGGDGTVFVPLQPDDPLFSTAPGAFNMLTLTRATNQGGDLTADNNQTTSFVDQNQTYTSHPAHQVFLRGYDFASGRPLPTGRLIDGAIPGNIANWGEVKAQAAQLGIALTDLDVGNVPLISTDLYGHFIPGAAGFPQVLFPDGGDAGTEPDAVEGNPGAPISVVGSLKTNHAFLDDIAHNAAPSGRSGPLTPDGNGTVDPIFGPDGVTPALPLSGQYDDELLAAHFVTGDGRGNENIGLTAVHTIFHAEHNRLADELDATIQGLDPAVQAAWENLNPASGWAYGERLFQAARFVTEMQYQHLVFEEFARTLSPSINLFIGDGINFQSQVDPAITAEFAHAVYRLGHSMLTEQIRRTDPETGEDFDISLFQGFLNPTEFNNGPGAQVWTGGEAAGVIFQGGSREIGNEIDEFVTEVLRNELLGRPLDLATLNLARGRSEGIPPLNVVRQQLYTTFGHSSLAPYGNWDEFGVALRNPVSLVNFVAAYGQHPLVQAETTIERRRAAGAAIVEGAPFPGALLNASPSGPMGDDPATIGFDESLDDDLGLDGLAGSDCGNSSATAACADNGDGPDNVKGNPDLDESLDDDLGLDGLAGSDCGNSSATAACADNGDGPDDDFGVTCDTAPTAACLDNDLGPDGLAGTDCGTPAATLECADNGAGAESVLGNLPDLVNESLDDDNGPDNNPGSDCGTSGATPQCADNGAGAESVLGNLPDLVDESLDDDNGPDNNAGSGCGTSAATAACADNGAGAESVLGDNPATGLNEALDDIVPPTDASDFLFGEGAWADIAPVQPGTASGLNSIDLWMGGLAERPAPFGGMLGSTFNWVFEIQLENLQNADRFYYLERLDGLGLLAQLEGNSFAELIMRNTPARALAGVVFGRPGRVFRINAPTDVTDENGFAVTPPEVSFLSGGRIRYNEAEHVIWDGSEAADNVISNEGDDTFWGNGGNDRFEGGFGNDQPLGGNGDDILTDVFGDDVIKGGPGNDVITGGPGLDLLQGNAGDDFMVAGNDFTESFGGDGDDVMFTGDSATEAFAGHGDDWMEGGGQLDLLVGDENNQFQDDPAGGHDVITGGPGDDDYDSEGGDDIMIGDVLGTERFEGMLGFDWVTYRGDTRRVDSDMRIGLALPPQVIELRDRFDKTEGLSGWNQNDTLRGDDRGCPPQDLAAGLCLLDPLAEGTVVNHELTQAGINRIVNLRPVLEQAIGAAVVNAPTYTFDDGNILLGGVGSDVIEGRGANDIIDGDRWLNAQLVAGGNRYDSLKQFQAMVVAGTINPGTIDIERSIVTPAVGPKDCGAVNPLNCDTAVFTGAPSEYVFETVGAVTMVTHIPNPLDPATIGPDGVDALFNIERYMFLNNTPLDGADDILIDPDVVVEFSITPLAVDFGTIAVGSGLRQQVVTITNDGTTPLSVLNATLAVEPPAPDHPPFPFSIVGTTCTAPVAPGGTCTVTVGFQVNPEALGAPETADAYDTVLTVNVQGALPKTATVSGIAVDNTPATGAPAVVLAAGATGFTVGQQVTIDPAGIVDPDGLPLTLAGYTVTWQTAGGSPLGTGTPFTLPPLAAAAQIRALVSFTDGIGSAEGPLPSALSPVVGVVITGTVNAENLTAQATAGDDVVNAFGGADTVDTGAGNDIVNGQGGADNITLGAGNDVAEGGAGDDTIAGQGGNDTFVFRGTADGFDAITGGAGVDTIQGIGNANVAIGLRSLATVEAITALSPGANAVILGNAAANTFDFRTVTLTNIDEIDGGAGSDQITGSAAADVIVGGDGNDTLNGFTGADEFVFRFVAPAGTTLLSRGFGAGGGAEQDRISLPAGVTVTRTGANANRDTILTVRGAGNVLLGTIRIERVAPAQITLGADYFIG